MASGVVFADDRTPNPICATCRVGALRVAIWTARVAFSNTDPKGPEMHEYTSPTVNPESGAIVFTCSCGDCFSKRDMALHLRVYSLDAVRSFIQAYKKAGL